MADTSPQIAKENFNISKFKNEISSRDNFTKGTFFVCSISPSANEKELGFEFKQDDLLVCKAVNLPAEQLNFTTLKYHTRSIKIPTTREFGPMTLSFYNTGDYNLRTKFYNWMNMYNSAVGNVRGLRENYRLSNDVRTDRISAANSGTFDSTNPYAKMFATMELVPLTNGMGIDPFINRFNTKNPDNLEPNDTPLASYKFTYAFPTNIGPLQFSYDDDASFQTYDVEFQYLDMRYYNTPPEIPIVEPPLPGATKA